MSDSFFEPNQLLRDAGRLADIPGVIVQGRYDLVCPMKSAWELAQAWPTAELHIIPDAGHSVLETGITDALVRATDDFALRLG
jgi:proline iminopeptidase